MTMVLCWQKFSTFRRHLCKIIHNTGRENLNHFLRFVVQFEAIGMEKALYQRHSATGSWRVMVKPDAAISLLSSKAPTGSPGLKSPSDVRIVFNSTSAFTSNALERDLGLKLGILGSETIDRAAPQCLLISVSGRNQKFLPSRGSNPGPLHAKQLLSLCSRMADSDNLQLFYVLV